MLGRCFSLAGVAGVSGLMVWAGCASDSATIAGPTADAGAADVAASSNDGGASTADATTQDATTFVGAPIAYGNCAAFAKCGGDLVGDWTVSGGCLSEDTFADVKASCPGLQESNVVIKASGTIAVTATTFTRKSNLNFTAKVFVPKCIALLTSCATVTTFLTSGLAPGGLKFDSATCTATPTPSDGCNCDVATTIADNTSDTYTSTPDGTLTTPPKSGGADRTYDYCVTADEKLTFTETTASQTLRQITEATK